MNFNQFKVVVAQLVEQSLPIPEIRGLNPVIDKNLYILNICLLSHVSWKDENKEKEAGNGPFLKILSNFNKIVHFAVTKVVKIFVKGANLSRPTNYQTQGVSKLGWWFFKNLILGIAGNLSDLSHSSSHKKIASQMARQGSRNYPVLNHRMLKNS